MNNIIWIILQNLEWLFYSMFIVGVTTLCWNSVDTVQKLIRGWIHYFDMKNKRNKEQNKKSREKLEDFLANTFTTLFNVSEAKVDRVVNIFEYATIVTFAIVFIGGYSLVKSATTAFVMALFVVGIPIVFLVMKTKTTAIGNSREGDTLLMELTSQYKLKYYNIEEAIDATAAAIPELPRIKNILLNLSRAIKSAKDENDIDKALERFNFALDTNWSNILSSSIKLAVMDGIKITEALEDLLVSIKKAKKIDEISKRENSESVTMLKFLFPGLMGITGLCGVKMFDMTWQEYIHYQFVDPTGMMLFTTNIGIYIACVCVAMLWSKRKLDF